MDTILFILIGLIGLSLVVTIHEAGHFVAARWAGVEVEAFAIGWGKVLWSWKPGNTEYRLCLLPLGGYCKMKGEQDLSAALQRKDGAMEPTPGSLFAVSPWKRIVISVAGPLANLVFAFLVFVGLQLTGVPETAPEARILLASDVDGRTGLPADQAGLLSGDRITAVEGKPIRTFADLQQAITASSHRSSEWTVDRGGLTLTKTVIPRFDESAGRALVGVYPFIEPVVKAVKKDSLAALAGFNPRDKITKVDGQFVVATQSFFQAASQAGAKGVTVTVNRDGREVDLLYIPDGKSSIGLEFVLPTFPAQGALPWDAVVGGWNRTWALLGQMVTGLVQLITGKTNPAESLSGPLRITYYVGEVASQGFLAGWGQGVGAVASFLAFISLALFLMNLLPIPALDGGSVVVSIIEALRGKRLGIKSLMLYQQVGVFLILGLVLYTTFSDAIFLFGPK